MKTTTIQTLAFLGLTLGFVACGDKDDDDTGATAEADADTDSDTDADTDSDTDADTDTDTDADFDFATDDPSAYERVDRMGMPAYNTALITSKDEFNQADPSDDASLAFAGEIIANLDAFHQALDDDLATFGLTPCTVNGDGSGTCVQNGIGLLIPDTIKMDVSADAGFPNGRLLEDPVIDVTLAVALLDITVHSPTTFVGLLNPTENDKDFDSEFPYLADPH